MHPKEEKTLIIIKPDGIQRSLIGEVIKRYERIGLKLVAAKMLIPDSEMIEKHYTLDSMWLKSTGQNTINSYKEKNLKPPSEDPGEVGKMILGKLKNFMTSGPVLVMVWQGAHAVEISRKITGGTEPLTSDVGTIRGDFVLDSYKMSDDDNRAVRNIIHASGSVKEALQEIDHWFNKEEVINYRLVQESMLYDVDLDGILE